MAAETLKITFLGTGTSQGVPVIGCDCEVCQSSDMRDRRLRTSILIASEKTKVVIDCGPDFRQQMLRSRTAHIDAVLLTHEHNDHIIGLDDVRPFNFKHKKDMPVYTSARVMEQLKQRFAYVFAKNPYPGAPMLQPQIISQDAPFAVGDLSFQAIQVMHGRMPVFGFRIGSFTYITDMKTIAPAEKDKIKGSDYLVVNALHHDEHHTHLNLAQALKFIEEIQPKQAFLTHMSHRMGLQSTVNQTLLPKKCGPGL